MAVRFERWTPRAMKVLATARVIAAPAKIKTEDLFLALEAVALDTGDHPASRVLEQLGISPSKVLGKPMPTSCPPNSYASWNAFDESLSDIFPALVIEEAEQIRDDYVGTEHLLLFLARVGVPAVGLPYERIREAIVEMRKEN